MRFRLIQHSHGLHVGDDIINSRAAVTFPLTLYVSSTGSIVVILATALAIIAWAEML